MKLQPIFLFFSKRKLLKLQQHIDAHFESENKNDIPSYDTVSQMEYLDMFVREIFRMYPIAPLIINRQSTEEFHIKNIGTIPAGTRTAIDMYTLHFDPMIYGDQLIHIHFILNDLKRNVI
jgi:cytochrome P450